MKTLMGQTTNLLRTQVLVLYHLEISYKIKLYDGHTVSDHYVEVMSVNLNIWPESQVTRPVNRGEALWTCSSGNL